MFSGNIESKTRFTTWFHGKFRDSLEDTISKSQSTFFPTFQFLLVDSAEEVDNLVNILMHNTPKYRFCGSKEQSIDIPEINKLDLHTPYAMDFLMKNHNPIVCTSADPMNGEGLPLTLNVWRFYPENVNLLQELRLYGGHHCAHAINIIVCTKSEYEQSWKENSDKWIEIDHCDTLFSISWISEVPKSREECERK